MNSAAGKTRSQRCLSLRHHAARSTSVMSGPALFARLVWSALVAQSADQVGLAAAPIVAVVAFGAGAGATGLLQTVQTLPFLILSLPVGLLADRASRRGLMLSGEALRAASFIVIVALAAMHLLTLRWLMGLSVIGVLGTVAYVVTAPSLVPALVPRGMLPTANGRLELARSAAFAAGPALGGALVGWIGAAPAFAFAAGLSILAVVALASIREPFRPPLPARHPLHDLREGAEFVRTHPLLRPIALTAVVFNTSFFVLQAVYVPYAVHRLALSASGVGFSLATYGVGMVAGALVVAYVLRRLPFGAAVALGPMAGLAAALAMAATIWNPLPPFASLSFFLFGAGPIIWTITTTTLRQSVTPEGLLGRVSATIVMSTMGARPLGSAIGAFVGGWLGSESCLLVAAFGFLVQVGILLSSPVARLSRQPETTESP